ncbi:MAG: transposase, partial [Thaumarchaeota archaeon]|nr:transposase [Nitrososphaerota archaeon]
LPGTTFSSIEEKGTYDSKSRAGLTISELEKWLLIYITKVYHHKTHSSLGMAPIQKYNDGILGSDTTKGIGFYPRITDNKRVQLDFMPFVKRNVQRNGIVIDHIRYYDEVLSKYILPSSYPDKKKIKLTFKRDPRDISIIYFLDPHLNEYFEIPYRDVSKPPMSIWEHRAILKELNNKNISVDESSIFKAYQEMESLELDAIKRTRKTRKSVKNKRPDIKENTQQKKEINSSVNLRTKEIKAFDDIDDGAFN